MTRLQRTFLLDDERAERYIPRISSPVQVSRCGRLPVTHAAKVSARALKHVIFNLSDWGPEGWPALTAGMWSFYDSLPPLREFYLPGGGPRLAPHVMPATEAVDWFKLYKGRYVGVGEKLVKLRGADIFEHAGKDLEVWIDALERYQPAEGHLKLVQLGDMYELWIGFMSGLQKKANSPGGSFAVPAAKLFAEFWKTESATTSGRYASEQAKAAAALEGIGSSCLSAVFLTGNHDNYLLDNELRPSAFFSDEPDSVIAEHGHASDSFNSDDDAGWGWVITQLAFLEPEVRTLEPLAGFLLGKIMSSMPPRLTFMARGADLCYDNDRMIYVMGHTHQPMLKRVIFFPN